MVLEATMERFNGAAACSRRNDLQEALGGGWRHASMEPPHVRGGMRLMVMRSVLGRRLQWSRRMFAAEWRQTRHRRQNRGSFNGAAACSRRNGEHTPQPCSSTTCFNGAAACSRRNGDGCDAALWWLACFNGAAACSRRNGAAWSGDSSVVARLEWDAGCAP